jgi:hypothetical protein
MKTKIMFKAFVLVALFVGLLIPFVPAGASGEAALPTFSDFVTMATNDQADTVQGVYVPGVLADRVVAQPANDPGYISMLGGVVTQFSMAARYHVIGLVAHNILAGASFTSLAVGQEVFIVYGDGHVATYRVDQIARFQALQPSSENSSFVDLSTNTTYFPGSIFKMFYQGDNHVTFQTCISQDGNASWGRLFVTAVPVLLAYNSETRSLALHLP